jgi:hypothetical protein
MNNYEFMLCALRCASVRAKLLENEINSIGVALKGKMISPQVALDWATDIGARDLIGFIPEASPELKVVSQ